MKTRLEADEVAAQLERCDKENKMLKDEMNKEIEAVLLPFHASQLYVPRSVPLMSLGLSLSFAFDPPWCEQQRLTSFLTAGLLHSAVYVLSLFLPPLACAALSPSTSWLFFFFLQFPF